MLTRVKGIMAVAIIVVRCRQGRGEFHLSAELDSRSAAWLATQLSSFVFLLGRASRVLSVLWGNGNETTGKKEIHQQWLYYSVPVPILVCLFRFLFLSFFCFFSFRFYFFNFFFKFLFFNVFFPLPLKIHFLSWTLIENTSCFCWQLMMGDSILLQTYLSHHGIFVGFGPQSICQVM